jgi:Reductase C-terminal
MFMGRWAGTPVHCAAGGSYHNNAHQRDETDGYCVNAMGKMENEAFTHDAVRIPRSRGNADGSFNEVIPVELAAEPTARAAMLDLDTTRLGDGILAFADPLGEQDDALPWFWSDQYHLKLQIAGLNEDYDSVVLRGSPDTESFLAFYLKDRMLLAVDAVNRVRDFSISK